MIKIEIQKEIYFKDLAHTNTKAENAQGLPPLSQRTKKAVGIKNFIQLERPENQEQLCLKAEKRDVSAQTESKFTLPPTFCSIQELNGLDAAHLQWQGGTSLLNLPMQTLLASRNTWQTQPEIMFVVAVVSLSAIWEPRSIVKVICEINHNRERLGK